MNKKLIIGGILVTLVYMVTFVRLPELDYQNSVYVVSCSGVQHPLKGGFDYIPGKYLNFVKETGRRFATATYKSQNADVIAKFICSGSGELGEDHLPIDADMYASRVITSPDFNRVATKPQNYTLVRRETAHEPSVGEFVGKIAGLVVILVVGGITGKLFMRD